MGRMSIWTSRARWAARLGLFRAEPSRAEQVRSGGGWAFFIFDGHGNALGRFMAQCWLTFSCSQTLISD